MVSVAGTRGLTARRRRMHHDRLHGEDRRRGYHGCHAVGVMVMVMVESRGVILLMVMVMVMGMMVATGGRLLVVVIACNRVVVGLMMMMMMTVEMMIIVDRTAERRSGRGRRGRVGEIAAGGENVVDRVGAGPLESRGRGGGLVRESRVNRGRRGWRQLARRGRSNWKRTGSKVIGAGCFGFANRHSRQGGRDRGGRPTSREFAARSERMVRVVSLGLAFLR